MKRSFVLLGLLLSCLNDLWAFDPPRPPDTIIGTWTPFHESVMHAPVVEGTSVPKLIEPNSELLCFDKRMAVKSMVNGQLVEQCLYLNTSDGLVGHLAPQRTGGAGLCDIKPDDPKFNFFIYGLKGNTYHYYTRKQKETLKHYVSTGNSQTHLYQPILPPGSNVAILHKKTETRMYCDDKFKGKAYKFDGGVQTWYIFGRDYPEEMVWEGFIGNFGVGYLKTDKGLFSVLEMDMGDNSFKVTSLDDVNVCFDPRPFDMIEEQLYVNHQEMLNKQREKLAEEQAKLSSGDCIPERTALFQFRVEELRRQEMNLETMQTGNLYQNTAAQQALANMMDPKVALQEGVLETKIKICKKQVALSKNPGSATTQEKLNCLINYLSVQQSAVNEMEAKEIQFAGVPGKVNAEKSKILLNVWSQGCD